MNLLDLTKFFPSWWFDSQCFQTGEDVFFGTDEITSSLRKARKYCETCPAVVECLKHALTQPEEYGIWAGTSARSRENMRAAIDSGAYTINDVISNVLDNGFKWRPDGRRPRTD